jgi:hypothetical protein
MTAGLPVKQQAVLAAVILSSLVFSLTLLAMLFRLRVRFIVLSMTMHRIRR